MPYWGPGFGPFGRGYGWGPRPVIVEREEGGGLLGGLVGGLVGGAVSGAIVSHEDHEEAQVTQDDSSFTAVMKLVQATPEGGTVALKPEEFRALEERKMVEYDGSTPYVMKRKIVV